MAKKTCMLVIYIIIAFSLNLNAQNTPLDERNGYQDFTFGDSYQKWSNSIIYNAELSSSIAGNEKYYNYTGSCCQYLFDYKATDIILGFKDDKLNTISVRTADYKRTDSDYLTPQYRDIRNKLAALFGEPKTMQPFEVFDNIYMWEGENIALMLFLEYRGIKSDGRTAYPTVRCFMLMTKKDNTENLRDKF